MPWVPLPAPLYRPALTPCLPLSFALQHESLCCFWCQQLNASPPILAPQHDSLPLREEKQLVQAISKLNAQRAQVR